MSLFQALRPPRPALVRQIEPPVHAAALIHLAIAPDLRAALRQVDLCPQTPACSAPRPLLQVTGTSSGRTAAALLDRAPHGTRIAIARGARPRWLARARRSSLSIERGRHNGWARLELLGGDYRLDVVYLPVEIERAPNVTVLPGSAYADSPAELWLKVIHPHTALRIRTGSHRPALLAEVLAGVRATYVLPLRFATPSARRIVAVTDDVVAAQLFWLAGRRISARSEAPETVSPWEDDLVQAATQLGLGPASGDQLTLVIHDAQRLAGSAPGRIVELLNCRVQFADEEQAVE